MLKNLNKYIITVLIFYFFWLCLLPYIITKSTVFVCTQISKKTNYEISIENPDFRLSILPKMQFSAKRLTIKTTNNSQKCNIKDFSVCIRILPLITQKLHINQIKVNDLEICGFIPENAHLKKNFIKKLENSCIITDEISIKKFDIKFYTKNLNYPVYYRGKDFVYAYKNRFLKFCVNSNLNISNKNSIIKIDTYFPKNNDLKKTIFEVNVENLDISAFQNYLKYYLPQDLKTLSGYINIKADKNNLITTFNNCKFVMNDSAKSIIFPDKLIVASDFLIKKRYIWLKNVEIKAPGIDIFFNGKIQDYFGKSMPTVDFTVGINKSKIEKLTYLMPALNFEEINIYKLKKYNFYGDVIGNLSIKGRLPEPDIKGHVFINNGILIKPIPNAISGATVKLDFIGKYTNYDIDVPTGFAEKVTVNGGVEIYNIKYANMIVKSTQNVDLKVTQNVINPLHEILNFEIGPVPIMDITGKGNINIQIKGNRKNSHIWGDLNFKDANVSFLDIPDLKIKNINSYIKFNDEKATYTTETGTLNGEAFNVNGNCLLTGKFNFNVASQNQPTEQMYNAILNSTLIPDIKNILPKINKIYGKNSFNINVFGDLRHFEDFKFNKNTFAKGDIVIKNNNITLHGIDINNINGTLNVEGLDVNTDLKAMISQHPLIIKAKIKNQIADLIIDIPKFNPNFLLKKQEIIAKQYFPIVSVLAKYKGSINNIEYKNLDLDLKYLNSNLQKDLKFNSGEIIIKNGDILIKNLTGCFYGNSNQFNTNLRIDNAFEINKNFNGNLNIKTQNLTNLNNIFMFEFLPKQIKQTMKNYEFTHGAVNLNCAIKNNKISLKTPVDNISFTYIPSELPIHIINGFLEIRNNVLNFEKVNILVDKMPVLLNGRIYNNNDKPHFELYFTSKPQQEFIDKYINKKRIYPIKIKGDIIANGTINGSCDNYDIKTKVILEKGASVYHYGAIIGDIENSIRLYLSSKINNSNLKIKDFTYNKIITSQNGKETELNMLKAWGDITLLQNDMEFKNFRIKTEHQTDARIFNIIFRKSNIKEGQFSADLRMNGKLSNPKLIGNFHITETNIPFLDTTMKNIALIFKDKTIDITSKGDVLGNDITINCIMKNALQYPYIIEKANIYTKNMNLNRIVNKLKTAQADNLVMSPTSSSALSNEFKINSVVLNNVKIKADNIELRNLKATDVNATVSYNEHGVLNISDFDFDIANGKLFGNYKYNFKNNDVNLNLNADNINANDITYALFNLDNQIHGNLVGKINLSCDGTDYESCMQTISGNTNFNVYNGRMPKLGSLEYLLKASNLVKGGVTNLSINGVIDLITPLKTGEFSNIVGNIRIKDGIARNIKIITTGKDLSLYITGTYNFSSSQAKMQVFGLLTRKIATVFGPVGNLSINTLFNVIPGVDLSKDTELRDAINKIPGLELSNKFFRKFVANINGNITGEDYVKSFEWIN